jgi:hypothetical protein
MYVMKNELLLEDLRIKLNQIKENHVDIIKISNESIVLCKKVLSDLQEILLRTEFKTASDEVYFFKNEMVYPLSQLVYFGKVRILEVEFPKVSKTKQKKYLRRKFKKVNKFYKHNIEFVQYIRDGRTDLDPVYFTRLGHNSLNYSDAQLLYRRSEISTSHDIILARIKGYGLYSQYLKNRFDKLDDIPVIHDCNFQEIPKLQWTAKKVDLIELIYALNSSDVINNGEIGIKQLALGFEKQFNIELGDVYRSYTSIKLRNSPRLRFMKKLERNLTQSLSEFGE